MSGVLPSQKTVDLGSGDGRLVIALAKAGAKAYGFEVNPFLMKRANKKIKQEGLDSNAFVYLKNLWKQDLSDFDIVTIYAMEHRSSRWKRNCKKN